MYHRGMGFIKQISLYHDNDKAVQQSEPQHYQPELKVAEEKHLVKISIVLFAVWIKKAESLKQLAGTLTSQKSSVSAGFRVQNWKDTCDRRTVEVV